MKLTYWSHSAFLVETASHRLVIDPFLSGNPNAAVKAEDVECDYVLVTHAHGDHLGDAVDIAKRNDATIVATYELSAHCGAQGAKVHPMHLGGARQFDFGRLKLTLAHHGSGLETGDGIVELGNPAGLLITADGKTLYHAGDTALFLDMKLIGELDAIDVAILPIGDNFTMGIDDAAKAVEFLQPQLAIPMHYKTFDLIYVDPNVFVEKVAANGRSARVLEFGETITV